jgi:hypothetical protein
MPQSVMYLAMRWMATNRFLEEARLKHFILYEKRYLIFWVPG